jgi:DNA/RNA endonuclease YhcR with UshA esterase domain
MKLILMAITCLAAVASAQDSGTKSNAPLSLKAAEAKDHIGANAAVTGTVVEVNKAERLTRLNFDKAFPKQPFTAVIFSSHTNAFADLDQLKGKAIEVTGKITEYRERPQIVLTSTNQLKVLAAPPGAAPGPEK